MNQQKENPLDFTLWKKTNEGIQWDSPFGKGRPGWHTECVVMNHKLFQGQIDIHGGGMDLKFPHHENEIAQCEALYHHHLAKYWIHVGRLDLEGTKMSKSLGNVLYVKDLDSSVDGMILRALILFSPYRSIIAYSEELRLQYKKEYEKWQRAYKQALYELQYRDITNTENNEEYIAEFIEAMNQDFNVQNVLTLIHRIVRDMNIVLRENKWNELSKAFNSLKTILDVLGISLFIEKMTEEQLDIYKKWSKARKEKQYEEADKYRRILVENHII